MPTPSYWADKLVNKIISTRSNRREFLKATTAAGLSLSALGAIGVLSGCADVTKPRIKSPIEEIKDLMWGPSDPARVNRLIAILVQGIHAKDAVLIQAAAEGLVPHAGDKTDVVDKLIEAFKEFPQDEKLQIYLIQLLALNFIVNPQEKARLKILGHYWLQLPWRSDDNITIPRKVFSVLMYLGLNGYRQLRAFQQKMRVADSGGAELRQEFYAGFMLWPIIATAKEQFSTPAEVGALFTFKDRFPDFAALHLGFMKRYNINTSGMTQRGVQPKKTKADLEYDKRFYQKEENKAAWRVELKAWREKLENWIPEYKNENPETKTLALLNLDERSFARTADPTDRALIRDLSIKIINHKFELQEVKRVALSIIGSYPELLPEDQNMLVDYLLNSPDDDMVLTAAKGLRFREGLPAEKIMAFLAQKKKDDVKLGQLLEDLLLSSLDSPDPFRALVRSIIMTDPKNTADKKMRLYELRIWYLRLGDKRDDVVRQAIPSAPKEIHDKVIEWLHNISMINIYTPMPTTLFVLWPATQDGRMYGDQDRDSAIAADTKKFEQIVKELGVYEKILV